MAGRVYASPEEFLKENNALGAGQDTSALYAGEEVAEQPAVQPEEAPAEEKAPEAETAEQ